MTKILDEFSSLTDAERDFVRRIDKGGANRGASDPSSDEEGNALWHNPENLGFIECVGSYKWVSTEKYGRLKRYMALTLEEAQLLSRLMAKMKEKELVLTARTDAKEGVRILEPNTSGSMGKDIQINLNEIVKGK